MRKENMKTNGVDEIPDMFKTNGIDKDFFIFGNDSFNDVFSRTFREMMDEFKTFSEGLADKKNKDSIINIIDEYIKNHPSAKKTGETLSPDGHYSVTVENKELDDDGNEVATEISYTTDNSVKGSEEKEVKKETIKEKHERDVNRFIETVKKELEEKERNEISSVKDSTVPVGKDDGHLPMSVEIIDDEDDLCCEEDSGCNCCECDSCGCNCHGYNGDFFNDFFNQCDTMCPPSDENPNAEEEIVKSDPEDVEVSKEDVCGKEKEYKEYPADFVSIAEKQIELYKKKNCDYGSATDKLFRLYGFAYYLIMLEQKLMRIKSIYGKGEANFESLEDSLLDLSNYAILAVESLRKKKLFENLN